MSAGILPSRLRLGLRFRWQLRSTRRWLARTTPTAALCVLGLACLGLGGASRNNGAYMATLEILAIVTTFLAYASQKRILLTRTARTPALILAAFAGVAVLQLIPLPWDIWARLPGHDTAARGLELLEIAKSPHPLSLSPEAGITSLLRLIPPASVFAIALLVPRRRLFEIAVWALPAAGLASVALGIGQVVGVGQMTLHLYDWTNKDLPTGVFANVNHQATFLLMCLPFVAAGAARTWSRWRGGSIGVEFLILIALSAAVLLVGLILAFSMAGFVLAPAVLFASLWLLFRRKTSPGGVFLWTGVFVIAATLGGLLFGSAILGDGAKPSANLERDRPSIYAHTIEAIADFLPAGSGVGSFADVFPLYESPDSVAATYVNHAHNEYLEATLEMGLAGAGLALSCVVWWGWSTRRIWVDLTEEGLARRARMAASIAVGVVIVHSIADYPVRTTAVASVTALCIAIMVRERESRPKKPVTE